MARPYMSVYTPATPLDSAVMAASNAQGGVPATRSSLRESPMAWPSALRASAYDYVRINAEYRT